MNGAMNTHHELTFRLVVAVDVERYSNRDTVQQYGVQEDLNRVLGEAATRAGFDRSCWDTQVSGDGEMAVLPERTDLPRMVADFTRELDTALRALNHVRIPEARLRLRVAMHYGPVAPARLGFAGTAAVLVGRLLDSPLLRQALFSAQGRQPRAHCVRAAVQ
jgi:class 3 adenylate cyclase